MVDNLYFLFLDEIYTSNLNEFRKITREQIFQTTNHWHFGLAGTIFPATGIYQIYDKCRHIKNKYYPNKNDLVFHYVDTLNKRDNFSDLAIDDKKFSSYTSCLFNLVENLEYKYFASFVDKHELIKKHGTFNNSGQLVNIKKIGSNMFPKSHFLNYNLYLLCLKHIVYEFYNYLTRRRLSSRGIIVAEARGEKEDTELRKAFHQIYYKGISSILPTQLRNIILDLFIVPKTQNYVGTQITDMLIYPTYDSLVQNHNSRSDHFITITPKIKKKFLKSGIVTIP